MLLKLGILLLFFLPVVESFNRGAAFFFLYAGAIIISFPILWKKRIRFDLIDVLFLIFLIVSTISTLFSISFLRSGIELSRYYCYFLIFISIRNYPEENEIIKKFYINSILVNSIILSFLLIVYQLWDKFLPMVTSGMNLFYPTFGHNRIADILILLIPLLLTLKYPKYLLIFFSIVLAVSFGRGAMISLAFALIIFNFLTKQKSGYLRKGSFAYLFLAFIMIFVISLSTYVFPMNKKTLPNYSGSFKPLKYDLRTEYFRQAITGFADAPLTGKGLDTFRYSSQKYQSKPNSWSWYSHNQFLQIFNETGFFGGTVFLMMTAVLFWKAYEIIIKSADNYKKGIFIAILASTLHSLIDYDWQYVSILLFVFSGFAIVLPRRSDGKIISGKLLVLVAVVQLSIGSLLHLSDSDRVLIKANQYLGINNITGTLRNLEIQSRLDKANKEIYILKAQIYKILGDEISAQNNLQKARELNPLDINNTELNLIR